MRFVLRFAGLWLTAFAGLAFASPTAAQDLVHEPVNPAFGGNPFNADYLLGTATPQRPDRPTAPGTEPLTEAEQFARQIQSRLLSALSSSIVTAITGSDPGTTGEFTVGDQTIRFERTLSEIRLIIVDNVTGEVTEIVVPVFTTSTGSTSSSGLASAPDAVAPGVSSTKPSLTGAPLTQQPLTPGPLDQGSLTGANSLGGID